MAKKTTAKRVRPTIEDRLNAADREGFARGASTGREAVRQEYLPRPELKSALADFAQQVQGWPIDDNGVVALIGTDLRHICNMAVPARTLRAIAQELGRLGYKR